MDPSNVLDPSASTTLAHMTPLTLTHKEYAFTHIIDLNAMQTPFPVLPTSPNAMPQPNIILVMEKKPEQEVCRLVKTVGNQFLLTNLAERGVILRGVRLKKGETKEIFPGEEIYVVKGRKFEGAKTNAFAWTGFKFELMPKEAPSITTLYPKYDDGPILSTIPPNSPQGDPAANLELSTLQKPLIPPSDPMFSSYPIPSPSLYENYCQRMQAQAGFQTTACALCKRKVVTKLTQIQIREIMQGIAEDEKRNNAKDGPYAGSSVVEVKKEMQPSEELKFFSSILNLPSRKDSHDEDNNEEDFPGNGNESGIAGKVRRAHEDKEILRPYPASIYPSPVSNTPRSTTCEICGSGENCKEMRKYHYYFIGGAAFNGNRQEQDEMRKLLRKHGIWPLSIWEEMRKEWCNQGIRFVLNGNVTTPKLDQNSLICMNCMNNIWFQMLCEYRDVLREMDTMQQGGITAAQLPGMAAQVVQAMGVNAMNPSGLAGNVVPGM